MEHQGVVRFAGVVEDDVVVEVLWEASVGNHRCVSDTPRSAKTEMRRLLRTHGESPTVRWRLEAPPLLQKRIEAIEHIKKLAAALDTKMRGVAVDATIRYRMSQTDAADAMGMTVNSLHMLLRRPASSASSVG